MKILFFELFLCLSFLSCGEKEIIVSLVNFKAIYLGEADRLPLPDLKIMGNNGFSYLYFHFNENDTLFGVTRFKTASLYQVRVIENDTLRIRNDIAYFNNCDGNILLSMPSGTKLISCLIIIGG